MTKFIRITLMLLNFFYSGFVLAAEEELRDVKPPVDFPTSFSLIFRVAFFILMLILGWMILSLRKRRRARNIEEISKLPWEVALEQISLLEQQDLPQKGRMDVFYVALSDIIRRYFEDQLSVRAPEMTTEEFLVSCRQSPRLSEGHKIALKEFMEQCDMVKFARHNPGTAQAEEGLRLARKLVEETKDNPKPA